MKKRAFFTGLKKKNYKLSLFFEYSQILVEVPWPSIDLVSRNAQNFQGETRFGNENRLIENYSTQQYKGKLSS